MEWVVGFIEGDGQYNVTDKVSLTIPQLTWDVGILEQIKNILGIGAVMKKGARKGGKSHQFIVDDEPGLLKIIELLNGRIQINRKEFEEFVAKFNKEYGHDIQIRPSEDMINLNRG